MLELTGTLEVIGSAVSFMVKFFDNIFNHEEHEGFKELEIENVTILSVVESYLYCKLLKIKDLLTGVWR